MSDDPDQINITDLLSQDHSQYDVFTAIEISTVDSCGNVAVGAVSFHVNCSNEQMVNVSTS